MLKLQAKCVAIRADEHHSSLCTFIGMKHISPTFMYIIPMYLRLKTFTKTLPQMSFHLYFLLFLCRSGAPPVTLLTAGALTDPRLPATASNVCTTDARLGGVGRVPPKQKSWLRRCVDSVYDNVILLGDLNHNYVFGERRCGANPLYQLETLYDMKQLVDVPTRETLNTSSLLDVIFTTNYQSHTTTGVYKISVITT